MVTDTTVPLAHHQGRRLHEIDSALFRNASEQYTVLHRLARRRQGCTWRRAEAIPNCPLCFAGLTSFLNDRVGGEGSCTPFAVP
jgi:hypothetical protein